MKRSEFRTTDSHGLSGRPTNWLVKVVGSLARRFQNLSGGTYLVLFLLYLGYLYLPETVKSVTWKVADWRVEIHYAAFMCIFVGLVLLVSPDKRSQRKRQLVYPLGLGGLNQRKAQRRRR